MSKNKGGSVLDLIGELSGAPAAPAAPAAVPATAAADYPRASLDDIEVDPNQPRKDFPQADLEDLAASIELLGILEPLVLRETGFKPPFKKKFVLLAGERRYRAAPIAGLKDVPYVLRNDIKTENLFLAQMVENTQRQDLTDFEVAQGIRQILDEHPKVKKGELAKLLNRSAATISKLLGMLDEETIEYCKEGLIRNSTDCSLFKSLSDEQKTALVDKVRAEGRAIGRPDFEEIKEKAAQALNDQKYREQLEKLGQQRIDGVADAGTAAPDGELQADTGTSGPAAGLANDSAEHTNDDFAGVSAIGGDVAPDQAATEAGAPGDDPQPHPDHDHDHDGTAASGDCSGDLGADSAEDHAGDFSHGGDAGDFKGNPFGNTADSGSATSSGTSSSSGEKSTSKTCSMKLKVEDFERLIPHFVDKAEDKVEVRIENDIAIAIIENMGGTVPDDPADYPATIRGLLV